MSRHFKTLSAVLPVVLREPDKCSAMAWFPVNALPEDMIPNRRRVFLLARTGVPYSETVYQNPEEEEQL